MAGSVGLRERSAVQDIIGKPKRWRKREQSGQRRVRGVVNGSFTDAGANREVRKYAREKKKRETTHWTTPFSASNEASPKGPFSSFGFKTGTCQVQFRKHARFANLECDFLTGPVFF